MSRLDDLSFSVCSTARSESPMCLVCSPSTLHNHLPAGLVSRTWIIVAQCGDYKFQVLLRTKDKGTVTYEDELYHLCGMLSKSSGYKFCPGLDKAVYNDIVSFIMIPKVFDSCLSLSAVWISHDVSYGTNLLRIAAYLKGTWKRYCASPARHHLDQRVQSVY